MNRQLALFEADVHVTRLHARHVRKNQELVLGFQDVHPRGQGDRPLLGFRRPRRGRFSYQIRHWLFSVCVRDYEAGVALRATVIVDPHNVIQHISVNSLSVGRNPKEALRILDALQTDELCACNRPVGGDVIDLKAA